MTKKMGCASLKKGFAVIKMLIYLVSVTAILNGHTLLRRSGIDGAIRGDGVIK